MPAAGQRPRRTTAISAPRRDRRRHHEPDVGWSKPLAWRVLALILLMATFLTPRIAELDRLVTPDEPIWLARSANFYEALSSGDLGSTYQFAHPGVTVMWLGAAGYAWKARDYADRIDGQILQRPDQIAAALDELGYEPLDVMVAGRTMIVLALTLVFGLAFLFALRLLPFWTVVFGFAIVALDPFPLALSRLLHIDATAAYFMLLSVLAGSVYLFRGKKRSDLITSGVAAGLAVLTRSQMGVLAVWFALMLLLDARNWATGGGGWMSSIRNWLRPLTQWSLAAFATCLILWPALWTSPERTVKGMLAFAETAAIQGHERTVVFAGQLYEGDPGFQFYPTTFLWRATPPVILGVGCALAAVVLARRFHVPRAHRRIALSLMLAMGSYGLLMSFAAKKFDRYLLPVYPLAALLAAWGLITIARRVAGRAPGPVWAPAAIVAGLTLVLLLDGVRATSPYFLSYYNPMLGGAVRAPESMMVGWGEGLDQVADYLNREANSPLVAATEAWPPSLSYFLDDDNEAAVAAFVDDPRGISAWSRSDFYVLYITSLSRGDVWPPWVEELEDKAPVLTVTLNGLDYIWLYDLRGDALPDYLEQGRTGMTIWDGIGRMVASTKADHGRFAQPGDALDQIVYFDQLATEDLDALAGSYQVRMTLADGSGEVIAETSGPFRLADSVRHGQHELSLAIDIPSDLPLGTYSLGMQVIAVQTGASVQGFSFLTGERLADTVVLDIVRIVSSDASAEVLADLER